jgi:hypothetical protein
MSIKEKKNVFAPKAHLNWVCKPCSLPLIGIGLAKATFKDVAMSNVRLVDVCSNASESVNRSSVHVAAWSDALMNPTHSLALPLLHLPVYFD